MHSNDIHVYTKCINVFVVRYLSENCILFVLIFTLILLYFKFPYFHVSLFFLAFKARVVALLMSGMGCGVVGLAVLLMTSFVLRLRKRRIVVIGIIVVVIVLCLISGNVFYTKASNYSFENIYEELRFQ